MPVPPQQHGVPTRRSRPTRPVDRLAVHALPRRTLLALLLALAAPAAAGAQALRIQVTEEGSGASLPGVIVEVHRDDPAGPGRATLAVAGVTADGGSRLLPLGAAGTYRVRARRIGFQPFLSGPVTVAVGQTVELPIRMPARRVALPAMVVAAERRCDARAVAADTQVATVWEEVRKALTVSELSRRDRAASAAGMRARAFERHLDERDGERRLFVHPPQPISSRPFEAREPAELSDSGYVRRADGMVEFLAPDERVLLSDEFVADHCFTLAAGDGATAGLVGLEFSPAPDRRVPEVAGVLWIDSTTAELRHLDFWFVDRELPSRVAGPGRAGGQVVFARLPDGAWSPAAWRLRMPVLEPRGQRLDLSGWVEIGAVAELPEGPADGGGDDAGEPAEARPAALARVLAPYLALTRPARVTGIVLDSLLGAPLSGARVHLSPARDPEWTDDNASPLTGLTGTGPRDALTDAAGRFALDSAPAGYHRVHVTHPDLDSAGLAGPELHLRLAPGGHEAVTLAVPPRESYGTSCTASAATRLGRRGTLFGTVRRAADGVPLSGAPVTVRWTARQAGAAGAPQGLSLATRTGEDGIYRVCDLPLGEPLAVSVEATVGGVASGPVTLLLGDPRDVMRRDLVVPTTGGVAVVPVAGQLDALRAVATGRAVDEQGAAVTDAQVSLFAVDGDGSTGSLVARARTDSIGNFRLLRLPLGEHEIAVQRMGYRMLRQRVALRAGDTTRVLFTVPRVPTTLGAVQVVAARSIALREVDRRRHQGFGQHVAKEEIDRRPTLTALFHGIRGLRLVSNVQGEGMPGLYPGDGGFGQWVAAVPRTSRRGGRAHGECALALFVDGVRWSYTDLARLRPADLVAIEVYTQVTQVPAAFRTSDGACGAVLVWTGQAP